LFEIIDLASTSKMDNKTLLEYVMTHLKFTLALFAVFIALNLFSGVAISNEVNFKYNYLTDGSAISPWGASVGNKNNWYIPFSGDIAETKDGDLKVSPSIIDAEKKGLLLTFQGKNSVATLSLSGPSIDVSSIENQAALAFDFLLESKVTQPLSISMGCTYPCKGTVNISQMLKKKPQNIWITFPVPLNCFSKNGANLSKITSPFIIESAGKLKINITNIRLIQLPEGEKGCV
jgi:hypothetical protein